MWQAFRATAWLSFFLLLFSLSAHAAPRVTITPTGEAQTVFDWSRDACETWDIPDAPARAFRDASGQIYLLASHHANRAAIGPDFESLRHLCPVVFEGSHADAPEAFDDRAWLSGLYTADGQTVYALVHNEFQGNHRAALCPSQIYIRCWRNAITFAVSRDGGRHFAQPTPPAHLVATPPYRYEGDHGRNVGYFNPTNIIRKDGHYMAMFSAAPYRDQEWGACVMRTDRIDDPSSWRAWNGKDFTVQFVDPYVGPVSDPSRHVCAPVGKGKLITPLGGIVRHQSSGAYILLMAGTRDTQSGIYASASWDLIDWSEPSLVWALPMASSGGSCPQTVYDYPSLIDAASSDRNFASVGDGAALYFVAHHYKNCRGGPDRDLMRRPVRLTVEGSQP